MIDKVQKIKEWIKEKIACWCNESQCEVPESPKQIIEGKILALREMLSFINSLQEEPLSEDLGDYAKEVLSWEDSHEDWDRLIIRRTAHHFAEWQKEQMMTKAIDVEVKVDAGGYPYIDRTIELYDYDKDAPLAKAGDKYKVILIKEG